MARSATSSRPKAWRSGATVSSGPEADILVGNALPLKNIPGRHRRPQHRTAAGQGRADGAFGGYAGAAGFARRRRGAAETAFGRNPARFDRLHGDDRRGGQQRSRKHFARQGRTQALAGQEPAQPRRFHEPGRSPARRRRRQNFRRTSSGDAVGPADARLQDAQQQAHRQIHRERPRREDNKWDAP